MAASPPHEVELDGTDNGCVTKDKIIIYDATSHDVVELKHKPEGKLQSSLRYINPDG